MSDGNSIAEGGENKRRGRPPMAMGQRVLSFLSKIEIDTETGCWLWTGKLHDYTNPTNTYGVVKFFGVEYFSHRFSMFLFRGANLEDDRFICHECDTRRCVYPLHLWYGNAAANGDDRDRKGRHRTTIFTSERHWKSKLTFEQAQKIRMRHLFGDSSHKLAEEYGVCIRSIYNVVHLKTYTKPPGKTTISLPPKSI
jgi:hypothetical protein